MSRLFWGVLLLWNQTQGSMVTVPLFENYPTKTTEIKLTQKLNIGTPFARRFKTMLSQELKRGPDFAGKYRIVRIGCGSGCVGLAVLDCEVGTAYDAKMTVEQSNKELFNLGERIEYRKDSRLLVLRGCINEEKERCGVSQFEWVGDGLKQVSFTPTGTSSH